MVLIDKEYYYYGTHEEIEGIARDIAKQYQTTVSIIPHYEYRNRTTGAILQELMYHKSDAEGVSKND